MIQTHSAARILGLGSATALLASLSGLKVSKVPEIKGEEGYDNRLSNIGRHPMTIEGLVILQHVIGWWRIECPDDKKSVLASSEAIGLQAFSSDRVLAIVAHPEYNRAFMQEFVTAMYFKLAKISPELYEDAYYQSQIDSGTFSEHGHRVKVWARLRDWLQ